MVKENSEREKSRTLRPRRASKETGKSCRELALIGPPEPLKKHSAKSILRCLPIEGREAKGPDSVMLTNPQPI